MSWDEAESFWQAITQIQAREVLVGMQVADFPWKSKDDRKRLHKHFHKLAYPKIHDSSEVVTTEELAKRLGAAINGK
jgi:hypothetical protein